MARYIDANVLKEKLLQERDAIPLTRVERYSFGVETPNRDGIAMRGGINKALRCMEQTPTADVVKVVRCKDCKYCEVVLNEITNEPRYFCTRMIGSIPVDHTDFCSKAKTKGE